MTKYDATIKITVGILTVSDRSSQGLRPDGSGPALKRFDKKLNWEATEYEIVPDDQSKIQEILEHWSDSKGLSLILTTGGTGLGPRDVTPEATRKVLEKELPGMGEWLRLEGLKATRTSLLSRGVCGSRGKTLILNLPGNPRGCEQSLSAVADLIPHALAMLRGTDHEVVGIQTGI